MTLIAAMKQANSADPAKYLPELAKISYDGITGKIEFDEQGDTKNGAITLYHGEGRQAGADGDQRRRQDREGRRLPKQPRRRQRPPWRPPGACACGRADGRHRKRGRAEERHEQKKQ